ncbi:MAG: carboxypeptidase regulatory-like domain-containing protein [Planctomycetales bacterium]|nr:carboxypeptidase regulatory-like domain-containing protein [Planctomycetales bacterium]
MAGRHAFGDELLVDGTLIANGTAAAPVIFTSERDSSIAIDIDNGSSAPGRGNWDGVRLSAGSMGNLLDHVEIRHAGAVTAALITAGGLTMRDSVIRESNTFGIRITGSNPAITNITLQNNTFGAASMDLASNPSISGVTLQNNGTNALALDPGELPSDGFWDDPDIPYRLTGDVTVPTGKTLTVGAGQIVAGRAAFGDELHVNGTLIADGTTAAPIIFTSDRDSSIPFNIDNASTGPGRGNWDGVRLNAGSTGNLLDHVEFRYAGNGAAALVTSGALTMSDSAIRESGTSGMRITGSTPAITNITLQNNSHAAISMDLGSNPSIVGVALENNGVNALALDAGELPGDGFWDDPDIPYRLSGDVTVPTGKTLTVGAGQVVAGRHAFGDELLVDGTLIANGTAAAPVIFTSERDGTVPDNIDNTSNSPGRGNWDGVRLNAGSTRNLLDHVEIRYAGANTAALLASGELTMSDSAVRESGTSGMRITGSTPAITNITLQNNSHAAISMDLASNPAISGVTLQNNGKNALTLDSGTIDASTSWNNPGLPYLLTNDVTVASGQRLTIGAGQVVVAQAFADIELIVEGTLHAEGTPSQRIVFTSERDTVDGINFDNSPNSPGRGNWGGIRFDPGSVNNLLSRVEVRFAGANQGAVKVVDATLELEAARIIESGNHAVHVTDRATVDIRNSIIARNSFSAIRADNRSTVSLTNNTLVANNTGVEADGLGTLVSATNNLITNHASSGISRSNRANLDLNFNDVFNRGFNILDYRGLIDLTGTDGNISVDPMYVDFSSNDFHLQPDSPVIDAGTSSGTPQDDFDFNWRVDNPTVDNTGDGPEPFYDLGALEVSDRARQVSHRPVRDVAQIVKRAVFTFRDEMDRSSFTLADDILAATGPVGSFVITGSEWLNDSQLAITFVPQAAAGTYELLLAPTINNLDGLPLDIDVDSQRGEASDDQYAGTWTIVPPRILHHDPSGSVNPTVSQLTLTFDRQMDVSTFDVAEDIISFEGPEGSVVVSGSRWLDERTLALDFAAQDVLGYYELIIGPNIIDIGDNLLDQNQNRIAGEVPSDYYQANFTLADIITVSGAISSDTTWSGIVIVEADVEITGGATLTIAPGTIIKLESLTSLTVESGATLNSNGTAAQPVVVTSVVDDSVGGDTNRDGERTEPFAGDWERIDIAGGTANFNHTTLAYGGGSPSGSWQASASIRTRSDASVTIVNSNIVESFFDGILVQGGLTTITNSVIESTDRGVVAWLSSSEVEVLNSTFYDNRIGLLGHGGTLNVVNSLVIDSIEFGIDNDINPDPTVSFSNIYTPNGSDTRGFPDPIGSDNNLSINPRFINSENRNYRLDFGSPVIDAANGAVAPTNDKSGSPRFDDPRSANTGIITPDNHFADIGAFEFVEGADSDLDLVVSTISGPPSGIAGGILTVAWSGRNIGTGIVSGSWRDRVYLSSDKLLSLDDKILGDAVIQRTLGTNQAYESSLEFMAPNVLPGDYYVLVRTNADNSVFEGRHLANNNQASDSVLSLDLPTLALGDEVIGRLERSGDSVAYRLNTLGEASVRVSLDGPDDVANELYVLRGDVPTRQRFDQRSIRFDQADQAITIDNADSGEFFVLVHGSRVPNSETFALRLDPTDFEVSEVTPSKANNVGLVTFSIGGAEFTPDASVVLKDQSGTDIEATSVHFFQADHLQATFDLSTAAVGSADLSVVLTGNATATLTDAIEITEGGRPGRLVAGVVVPSRVRLGRDFNLTVEYHNDGDTDLIAPIFRVTNTGLAPIGLSSDEFDRATSVELVGINPDGPSGILPPGARGSITLFATASSQGTERYTAERFDPTTEMIDFEASEADMRPPGLDDTTWNALFAQVQSQIGVSWDDYRQTLADNVPVLPPGFGLNYSVSDLFRFEVEEVRAALGTSVSGRVFLESQDFALPDAEIVLEGRDSGRSYSTVSRRDGSFLFYEVEPDTYDLRVANYVIGTNVNVTVADADVDDVTVVARNGNTIQGVVVLAETSEPVVGAVVTAFTPDGRSYTATTQFNGTYTLRGLPAGTFEVFTRDAAIGQGRRTGINLVGTRETRIVDLSLEDGASVSGQVTDGASTPIADAMIIAYDDKGLPVGIGTHSDEQGNYAISALAAGTYTIQASNSGAATIRTTVSVGEEEQRTNVNFTLIEGGSVTGTVRASTDTTAVPLAIVIARSGDETIDVTQADSDGNFTLSQLPTGSLTLDVSASGFVSQSLGVTLAAGEMASIGNVDLDAAGSISATITSNISAVPLSGLIVRVWDAGEVVADAISDSNGQVAFTDLEFKSYELVIGEASGISRRPVTLTERSPSEDLSVGLDIIGQISGTVYDEDGTTPLSDVSVLLSTGAAQIGRAQTDSSGNYTFHFVAEGTFDIRAFTPEHIFSSQTGLVVTTGSPTIDADLVAGGSMIEGTIRSAATGLPVPSARILVSGDVTPELHEVLVDENGFYQVAVPPGAHLELIAIAEPFAFDFAQVTATATTTVTTDFSMQAGGTVTGTITDSVGGVVLAGATVFLRQNGGPTNGLQVFTDASGQYELQRLKPGTYDFIVIANDKQTHIQRAITVTASSQSLDAALVDSTSMVFGTITDSSGNAVADASVRAEDADGNIIDSATTDEFGEFELTRLPDGDFTILAESDGSVADGVDGVSVTVADNIQTVDFVVAPTVLAITPDDPETPSGQGEGGILSALFSRREAKRFENELTLPPLPPGRNCVASIESHREAAESVRIRELAFEAWQESTGAGNDVRSANAGLLLGQTGKLVASLGKAYLRIQKMQFSTISSVGLNGLNEYNEAKRAFEVISNIRRMDTLIKTGTELVLEIRKAQLNNVPAANAGTLLKIAKVGRQLVGDTIKIVESVSGSKLPGWGGLNDFLGLVTDGLSVIKATFDLAVTVGTALEDADTATKNRDIARDLYIQASVDADFAIEDYQFEVKHCADGDPMVNSPDDVPLPAWAGGGSGGSQQTRVESSFDPNDKIGPAAFGDGGFLQPTVFSYMIQFENDPELGATLPAQEVFVTDTLDEDLDLSTVEFGTFGFNNLEFDVPPGLSHYETTLDLRPDGIDLLVPLILTVDFETRVLSATFGSLDPLTGLLPDDIDAGFLPVNDKAIHNGEGFFTYNVRLNDDLLSGTEIHNQAQIVFDVNEPILTPETLHTIDVGEPASNVEALSETVGLSFNVSWFGSDDPGGSGIGSYDIYVSTDDGPFVLWLNGTSDTSATFEGDDGKSYAFYSMATDNVGHVEQKLAAAEAVTTVVAGPPWQNHANVRDVNGDMTVAALDVLIIINELNDPRVSLANGVLPVRTAEHLYFYDVSGDGIIAPFDGLLIINFLNDRGFSEGESPEELPILPPITPGVWNIQQDTDSGNDDNTNELNFDDPAFSTDINAYRKTSVEVHQNASQRSPTALEIEGDVESALDSLLEQLAEDIAEAWER